MMVESSVIVSATALEVTSTACGVTDSVPVNRFVDASGISGLRGVPFGSCTGILLSSASESNQENKTLCPGFFEQMWTELRKNSLEASRKSGRKLLETVIQLELGCQLDAFG